MPIYLAKKEKQLKRNRKALLIVNKLKLERYLNNFIYYFIKTIK